MKNFDWKTFLKQNSIFKSLDDKDIEQLLKGKVSEERDCAKGSIIIREGEFNDSVFLIGTGSVKVVLQGRDGKEINISSLGKGEFFGEMSPVEGIRRTATVLARENSTLLEVNGEKFCDIMRRNHIVAFNVLLKLSERLRHVSEHILAVKLKDADEKIDLFNTKLDAELKAVEASLKAALAVFEQTKMRTDEVIKSAEKSSAEIEKRSVTLKTIVSAAAGLAAILAFFGIKTFWDFTGIVKEVEERAEKVSNIQKDLEKLEVNLELLPEIRQISREALFRTYNQALATKDKGLTTTSYEALLKLNDSAVTNRLLSEIEVRIAEGKDQETYEELLATSIDYLDYSPMEKIIAYYLFLAVLILDLDNKEQEYEKTLSGFKKHVEAYEGKLIKENQDFSMIETLFGQDQKKQDLWFKYVKPLIP